MSNLLRIEVENYKKVSAATLEFHRGVLQVCGKNGQGKTSALDAIEALVRGADAIPVQPIKNGSSRSTLRGDVGEYVNGQPVISHRIERVITAKGVALKLTDAAGKPVPAPETFLRGLLAKIAFDPLAFASEDETEQDKTLKKLLGLDFTALDAEHAQVYEARTAVNRELKAAKAKLDAMPDHLGVPKAERPVLVLTQMLKAAGETALARERASDKVDAAKKELARRQGDVADLESKLERARFEAESAQSAVNAAQLHLDGLPAAADVAAVSAELDTIEQTNAKVRQNLARAEQRKVVDSLDAQSAAHTARLEAIEADKTRQIAEAKFPIEGMGFDEVGPTIHSVPLKQCNRAMLIRLSMRIAIEMNPGLKLILIREGNDLDEDSLAIVIEMAEAEGYDVIIERIKPEGDGRAVFIEDGELKEPAAAE